MLLHCLILAAKQGSLSKMPARMTAFPLPPVKWGRAGCLLQDHLQILGFKATRKLFVGCRCAAVRRLDCANNISGCMLIDCLIPLIVENSNVVYFLAPELVFHPRFMIWISVAWF